MFDRMTTGRCPSCAEDDVFFGHVDRIAEDERGAVLLRCPQCGLLYEDGRVSNEPVEITAEEAAAWWGWRGGGRSDY